MKAMNCLLIITLFCSASAYGLTAESDTNPGRLTKSKGVTYYNYNVEQIVENTDFGTRTFYRYDYVVIKGTITEQKIKDALDASVPLTTGDLDRIEAEHKAKLLVK